MHNREQRDDESGGGRGRRALSWAGVVAAAVAVAAYVVDGRPLPALLFVAIGASMALRLTARSPRTKWVAEIGMAAGFVALAILLWIPLLAFP